MIDHFSPFPKYWNAGIKLADVRGNARLVAETFCIPAERIGRYLQQWDYVKVEEGAFVATIGDKAYDSDSWNCGQWEQGYDFIRAIGCEDPIQHGEEHAIWLPDRIKVR